MGAQAARALAVRDGVIGDLPPGADLPRLGEVSLGPLSSPFVLDRVARSSGWVGLAPTAYDGAHRVLHRTLTLSEAGPVAVAVSQPAPTELVAAWNRPLGPADRAQVVAQARRVLSLDVDLSELWSLCARQPGLAWVPTVGAGRLLRSPTVWEDLVKTVASAGCSYATARATLRRLVAGVGAGGFPPPSAVLAAGEGRLRAEIRAGYRAAHLVGLADLVVHGGLDPEVWLDPGLPEEEVLAALLRLPGIGRFGAETMLGLLGRPRGLALDEWARARLGLTEAELDGRRAALGRWAGTVLWLEATREWFGA